VGTCLWMLGDTVSPSSAKPAHHCRRGMIRFGNDIGLSMSDNPLSTSFWKNCEIAADERKIFS
jgi:hypothetical protein